MDDNEIDVLTVPDELTNSAGVDTTAAQFLEGRRDRQQNTLKKAEKLLADIDSVTDYDEAFEKAYGVTLRGRKMSARAPRYAATAVRSKTGKDRYESFLKAIIAFSKATSKVCEDLMPFTRVPG
jgi:hypothetical protein